MKFLPQILFFFGAIGVFNSFILVGYLLGNRTQKGLSNRLFGLFLLVLSLRVLKGLFYAFSTEEPIWFLQGSPSFFFLIGPLLISYVASVAKPSSFWVKNRRTHLLIWLVPVVVLTVFRPLQGNVGFAKEILVPLMNLQWLIYLVLTAWVIYKRTESDPVKLRWLAALLVAMSLLWSSFTFVKFQYFVSGSIVFSILFYAFSAVFIFKRKRFTQVFEKQKKEKVSDSSSNEQTVLMLRKMMTEERLFINPDLKLSGVAEKLQISSHELSRLVNENIGQSFSDYVNQFRVEEAKILIREDSKYTIEAIGNQCGFHSKSAFYNAFKKFTGVTPAKLKPRY